MPVISLAMLVGLMAMTALPPLNWLAGEWVIYQSTSSPSARARRLSGGLLGPLLAVGWRSGRAGDGQRVYGVTFTAGAPAPAKRKTPVAPRY